MGHVKVEDLGTCNVLSLMHKVMVMWRAKFSASPSVTIEEIEGNFFKLTEKNRFKTNYATYLLDFYLKLLDSRA